MKFNQAGERNVIGAPIRLEKIGDCRSFFKGDDTRFMSDVALRLRND